MKKTLLIAASILAPLTLQAEPGEGKRKGENKGPKGPRRELSAEVIAKFDTNGDGKLTGDERKAAGEAHKAEMLKKFDKDGDGKLSKEERKAAITARFDADGDGELNEAEEAEMKKATSERRARGARGKGKGPKGKKGGKESASAQ